VGAYERDGDPFPLNCLSARCTVDGMKRILALLFTVSVLVVLTPLGPVADAADSAAAVELILDSSGSMGGRDPSGGTKLDAAKRSMGTVIDGLPEGSNVALRVYGARYADKQRGCTDTQLVLPPAPLHRSAAKAALAGYRPVGQTPIGYALRQAAGDLPKTGQRTIVLVSDGQETCGPQQPCAVAAELAATGIDLHVDTVGFRVDNAARQQLTCIAQVTRGRYYDAPDAAALTLQLRRASNSALRPYLPAGLPVRGTSTPAGAPTLRPGQYVDTLLGDQEKFYAVDLADGVTPYLAATIVRPLGTVTDPGTGQVKIFTDEVKLRLLGAGGDECGSASESNVLGSRIGPTTGVAVPGRVGRHWDGRYSGASDTSCGLPGRYVLSVSRTQDDGLPDVALPTEIVFLAEPALDSDVSVLPLPVPTSAAAPLAPDITAAPQQVIGGGSYGAAARLSGSGTFTDTIRPGETLFYRVDLDWGQRLAYAVRFRADKDSLDTGVGVDSWIGNPARVEVGHAGDSGYYGPSIEDDQVLKGGTLVPVTYRNRESVDDAVRWLSLAGHYYLIVSMDNDDKGATPDVQLDVAVKVQGEPQGAPSQGPVAGAADPERAISKGTLSGAGRQVTRDVGPGPGLVRAGYVAAYVAGGGLALLLAVLAVGWPLLSRGRRRA
jgi:Ca-activated chloride channel family protein